MGRPPPGTRPEPCPQPVDETFGNWCQHSCKGGTGITCQARSIKGRAWQRMVARWRGAWTLLSEQSKRQALLDHVVNCTVARQPPKIMGVTGIRGVLRHRLLGVPVCKKAFHKLTRTSSWRACLRVAVGETRSGPRRYNRPTPKRDQMHVAIRLVVENFARPNPNSGREPRSDHDALP